MFDPALGQEDFIPCPTLAKDNGIVGLKRLVEAARVVFGADNINQFLLCCGWVIAGLHFQTILRQEGRFPILNAYGSIGSGKTIALEAALSLVGMNWASQGMISKVTISAVYEHLSKTGSLPVIWDDPPRGETTRELEEFCKAMYNAKPRVVRGNRQTPHSPIGFTSNHTIGGEHDAAFTRFARIPFYVGGNTQAIASLKEAMQQASGSFPVLIGIGYHRQEISAIESEFLAQLPLAHERIAGNLALIVYYAQKIVELVGAEEQPRQWVLDNLVPIENDAENNGDSLADFIRCIQVLEGKDAIGSWDKRLFTDENGVRWIAIHAASVWTEVQKAFQPATYNQKSLKAQLLKIGGQVNKSVRFHSSRDEVLAYKRAILTAKYDLEGNLIQPNPPQKKMKKAWLIPLHLFDINPDIDPDTEPPDRTPDNSGNGSGSPDGDGGNTSAETVLKLNSFSRLDNVATSISGSELSFINPATNVAKESNLYGSAANGELPTMQVYNDQNTGEAVLSSDEMTYPRNQTETILVSQSSIESVEQKNTIVPTLQEENMPRAVTLRRANGSLIPLPADYPGDRAKEPHQIAELLLAIQCKADWEKIVNKYGETCTLWVWRWCFNQAQRVALAEVISSRSVTQKLPIVQNQTDYYQLVKLSDRAGYLCQKSDGLVLACYLGFDARAEAEAAYKALTKLGFDRLEIRVAKRLRKCRLEILIHYPNFAQWRQIAFRPPFNCRATD